MKANLVKYQVYNGWRYTGSYRRKCDRCGKTRENCHEFIREDTPYKDDWNGYKYPEEPMMLGSECVNYFIAGKWQPLNNPKLNV